MNVVIPAEPLMAATEQAVTVLRDGDVGVLPTDTVYALVGDAFDTSATAKMFSLLRRGRDVPLPVLIRSPRQVAGLVDEVPEFADRLMASYWPGPLTLVFRAADGLTWDLGDTWGTVSLRMPADDLLLKVIAEIGPIAATAPPSATDVEAVQAELGDTVGVYVDAGPRASRASTIVDVSRGQVEVLREGAIPADDVHAVAEGRVGWGERPDRPAADAAGDPAPEPADDQDAIAAAPAAPEAPGASAPDDGSDGPGESTDSVPAGGG